MSLTDLEKKAGRVFRDACQAELNALNAGEPPGGDADPLLRVVRHPCAARGGASAGIALREHYRVSPAFVVEGGAATDAGSLLPEEARGIARVTGGSFVEPGLICFIWKDGRCPECRLVLRSTTGIVDLTARRPPERT